ncbi:Cof-type HAD-IIB family hydrolase [Psychrobacillus vulpis]|uniref:HAD family phosphatase n=1 Tax=Psychrobacillus vulpis TaxID=2325572 RepID=A0A544TQA6_9BACI|nr:Cof-type HAD-IIB family hydrolase [Psychrobacillus vulpis]TQR19643.1 HAD family phosphatase [Psychrobacillus vulpis]
MEAVVLDLDGTLLDSNKEISKRNIDSIIKLKRSGIPIIIATARPPRSVKFLLPEEIQSSSVMIYYNGAMIVSEELKINEHFSIDSNVCSDIIDYLTEAEPNHWLSIEVEDKWYSYKDIDYTAFMKITNNPEKLELEKLKQLQPTKILVSNISLIQPFIEKYNDKANIIITDSNKLIQIMQLNISKEYAVSFVSDKLNISPEKIVVFGDDFNDLGLFKLCGYPVAMGNAIEELKELAKEVTDTNDNDGVAKTLETLFKLGQKK